MLDLFINQKENVSERKSFYAKLNEYKISKKYRTILKNIAYISKNYNQKQGFSDYLKDETDLKKENNEFNNKNKEIIQLL